MQVTKCDRGKTVTLLSSHGWAQLNQGMYRWTYMHMLRFGVSKEEQCCKHCGINISINAWHGKCFRKCLRRIDCFWSSAKCLLLETQRCFWMPKYKGDGYWINVTGNDYIFFWLSFSTCRNGSKFHEVIIHFRLLQKVCATVHLVVFFLFSRAELNEFTGDT